MLSKIFDLDLLFVLAFVPLNYFPFFSVFSKCFDRWLFLCKVDVIYGLCILVENIDLSCFSLIASLRTTVVLIQRSRAFLIVKTDADLR